MDSGFLRFYLYDFVFFAIDYLGFGSILDTLNRLIWLIELGERSTGFSVLQLMRVLGT